MTDWFGFVEYYQSCEQSTATNLLAKLGKKEKTKGLELIEQSSIECWK